MVFEILIEACASFQRRIVLDSRFRGNDVMPALRLRSGQAPAGIQGVGCAPRTVDSAPYKLSGPFVASVLSCYLVLRDVQPQHVVVQLPLLRVFGCLQSLDVPT